MGNWDMVMFWVAAGALALAGAGLLVAAALRGRAEAQPAEAFDLQVYRDQLQEVERDAARGTIAPEDAERLRAEVSRRILAADAKLQAARAGGGTRQAGVMVLAAVMGVAVIVGAFALYLRLGAPGYGDLPRAARIAQAAEARENRPSQETAEAQMPASITPAVPDDYARLMEQLRAAVANRPDDLRGLALLAQNEANLGNFSAAHQVQERLVAAKGDAATAQDLADWADMLILAAGGYVSPKAETVLTAALEKDRDNGVALYYAGLLEAQTGRPDRAFRVWNFLLNRGPADAPWIQPIRLQIEEMAMLAGETRFTLPPAAAAPIIPGPTAEDMQNAAEMSEDDRQEMIRGMVQRLSDRLATEGGGPQDWARLIGALGVLGDTDQARAIWNEAQSIFAADAAAMDSLRAAARNAGVLQ